MMTTRTLSYTSMLTRPSVRRPRHLSPRGYLAAAVLIFLACAAVRIGLADRHGLWADELFSLAMATGHSLEHPADAADASLGDFVELPAAVAPAFYAQFLEHKNPPVTPARVVRAVFRSDTSPPGYYVLLYLWTVAVGTSDAAVRLFSTFWALMAFPLVWSIARQLGGRWAAVATGLIYAVSPLCVFYSVEGRMYSMLWFWTVCLMWLSLRLHRHGPGRPWTLAAWITVSAAGLLTHYFFLFVWAATCLWLMLHPGRLRRTWLIGAGLAGAALILPWYLRLPASLSNWRVTGNWLEWEPYDNFNHLVQTLWLPWQYLAVRGVWGVRPLFDYAAGVVFAALALLVLRRVRWFEARRQLLWLCIAGACLGPLAFDLWRGTYVVAVPRYAIAAMPAAFVLVGIALSRLRPLPGCLFAVAIVLLCLVGIRRMYLNPGRMFEPTREVGRRLAAQLGPNDLVLVHSIPSGAVGMARYLKQYRPADAAPPRYAAWVGQLGKRQMPDDLLRLIAGRERVTVVLVHEVGEPAPHVEWLKQNAVIESEFYLEAIRVYTFIPRGAPTFPAIATAAAAVPDASTHRTRS